MAVQRLQRIAPRAGPSLYDQLSSEALHHVYWRHELDRIERDHPELIVHREGNIIAAQQPGDALAFPCRGGGVVPDAGQVGDQLGDPVLLGVGELPGVLFAATGSLIGQRLGERRVVLAGLGLMVLGGIVTASAAGFTAAATGRVLSGIGAVLMNILLAKLVADWFTGKEMSTAMAVMLTSWPVGLGLGQVTLGALAARTSWRTALVATEQISISLLAPGREGPIRATGVTLRVGRHDAVAEVRIVDRGNDNRLMAVALVTVRVLADRN